MCGNLYFVKEVHIEGGKHLDHNIMVALCTDSLNIYRESLNLVSFLLYIVPEMNFKNGKTLNGKRRNRNATANIIWKENCQL